MNVTFLMPVLIAQADPMSPPAQPNPLVQLLPMILLFVGFWFLLIAPQRKKQKEQEAMIKSLQRGDQVLTSAGIYGEVTSVKGDRVVVKIGDNTKVEMNRQFIQAKLNPGAAEAPAAEKAEAKSEPAKAAAKKS